MMKYIVKGSDESVENVDILGEVRKVGDVVELEEESATPLVEEGKLAVFEDSEPAKVDDGDGEGKLDDQPSAIPVGTEEDTQA